MISTLKNIKHIELIHIFNYDLLLSIENYSIFD